MIVPINNCGRSFRIDFNENNNRLIQNIVEVATQCFNILAEIFYGLCFIITYPFVYIFSQEEMGDELSQTVNKIIQSDDVENLQGSAENEMNDQVLSDLGDVLMSELNSAESFENSPNLLHQIDEQNEIERQEIAKQKEMEKAILKKELEKTLEKTTQEILTLSSELMDLEFKIMELDEKLRDLKLQKASNEDIELLRLQKKEFEKIKDEIVKKKNLCVEERVTAEKQLGQLSAPEVSDKPSAFIPINEVIIEPFQKETKLEKVSEIAVEKPIVNHSALLFNILLNKMGIKQEITTPSFEIKVQGKQKKFKLNNSETLEGMKDMKGGSILLCGYQPTHSETGVNESAHEVNVIKGSFAPERNLITFEEGLTLYREIDRTPLNSIEQGFTPQFAYVSVCQIEYLPMEQTVVLKTKKNLTKKLNVVFTTKDLTPQIISIVKEKYGSKTPFKASVEGSYAIYPVKKKYSDLKEVFEQSTVVQDELKGV